VVGFFVLSWFFSMGFFFVFEGFGFCWFYWVLAGLFLCILPVYLRAPYAFF